MESLVDANFHPYQSRRARSEDAAAPTVYPGGTEKGEGDRHGGTTAGGRDADGMSGARILSLATIRLGHGYEDIRMRPLEEMGKYAVVVVDPPWPTDGFVTRIGNTPIPSFHKYNVMPISDIMDLPIQKICAQDAWVFLWVTNGMMPHAFNIMAGWGTRYRHLMTWVKSRGPKPSQGPVYNAEYIVVGSIGHPVYQSTKQLFLANGWAHEVPRLSCAKPEGFYDMLRRVTIGPRIDVFGRRRIVGFQSWGDEAPEGEALPDVWQEVLLYAT